MGRIWGSDWGSNRGSKWRSGAGVGGPGRTPFTVVKHRDLLRRPLRSPLRIPLRIPPRNPLRIPLRSTTRSLLFAFPPGVPCGLQPCKIWPLVGPQPFNRAYHVAYIPRIVAHIPWYVGQRGPILRYPPPHPYNIPSACFARSYHYVCFVVTLLLVCFLPCSALRFLRPSFAVAVGRAGGGIFDLYLNVDVHV